MEHARQTLWHLSHIPRLLLPFLLYLFFKIGSGSFVLPGFPPLSLPTSMSHTRTTMPAWGKVFLTVQLFP
jgi:hypothetical protein